ncbi:MAG: SAM-dependent methyltransferase [Haliscomenobacteraceae bacterium CHB4]|nr:putative methyltransferase [Saprospiraceae bacterium]MCE7924293.1 SAM-dependent methyltransferase [Haliscomenobacteraceae bacterium CHB4]
MKDNFSTRSAEYARFRPGYPPQLFDFLFGLCQNFDCAWDCATGNGQIAVVLSERFRWVEATDISANQLGNALQKPNVHYRVEAAESPSFPDHTFDLVTVGQAAHWFDFEKFYPAVKRVLKSGGILALIGYNLIRTDEATNALIDRLYRNILGEYWDAERRHVDASYATIPFPFPEMELPGMEMTYSWTRDHFIGYLGTWSAYQHYEKKNSRSPLDEAFIQELESIWEEREIKTVRFPIFGRIGVHRF